MRQFKCLLCLILIFLSLSVRSFAQTVIFNDPGTSYNNTDAMTTNTYGPVNIANCSSISFSVNYNFSLPFVGAGNMESSDECPFGIPPCQGDPTDPQGGGCDQCWDFLYVQFQIDGANVNTQLIGVPGSTNQAGTLTFGPICTNGGTAGIVINTQTWAANETVTFSNITITCWDAGATLTANPTTICSGQTFSLQSVLNHAPSVSSTLWTGPGTIVTPTQLTTNVNNAPVGVNTYTFTATDDNACPESSTVDVTVNQGPLMQDPPNITVCAQDQVDVVFVPLAGNPNFDWTNNNPAIGLGASGSGDLNFSAAGVTTPTTGTITVTPSENGCIGPNQTFTITVNPLPSVNQPNDVTVCAGAPVNVVFSGTSGSTFNWTNDNTAIGLGASGTGNINFNSINGTNQETATITVTPIRNGCPGIPATFNITVNPTPTMVDPPNITVCSDSPVDVTFSGSGTNPDYNWTNNNTAIGLGFSGTGDLSFIAGNVTNTTTGTIQVTPSENGCNGPSQNFTITVNPAPTVNQPLNVMVCPGELVSVNFTGSVGATFVWTNDNTVIGLAPSGTGNINFLTNMVTSLQVANVLVTPVLGSCSGEPQLFTITVYAPPVVNDPADQTVCSGAAVSVNFTGTGNPSFTWNNSNTAIGLGASGTGNISFTAATVGAPTTGTITVTPSANGCTGATQNFTLTVTPAPSMNQPTNVVACGGANIVSNFSGSTGATFSWNNSNTAIGLAASGTGDINFTGATVTSQQTATITVTPALGSCMGMATTFTITLNPSPTVNDPAHQTVCGGTLLTVGFSGTSGATFDWTNSNTAIGLGSSGTGDITFVTAGVSSSTTGTITVVPSANGCVGASQNFDITVIPAPVVNQPTSVSACSGTAINIPFTGTSGASFSWTNDNTAIGLAASGTGDIVFNAANLAAGTTANLSVTPNLNGCLGLSQQFTITVNPLPVINLASVSCTSDLMFYSVVLTTNADVVTATAGTVTGSGGNYSVSGIPVSSNVTIFSTNSSTGCQTQQSVNAPNCNCPTIQPPNNPSFSVVCEGANIPALTVTVGPGETVDWYATAAGGVALLTGSTSFTPSGNFPPGVYTFFAEAREIATGCTSATRTPVTLTVNPIPVTTQPADQAVCPGVNVTVNFSGTAGANYTWTNSNAAIGLSASGTGNISFNSVNAGNTALVANLSVTATLNGCAAAPVPFVITVNPTPTVTLPTNQTVCGGTMVNVVFSGTGNPTFDWTNNNTMIGLGASGTGNIGFTAANVTATEIANLSVTPTAQGCVGPTQNFSISVSPTPIVTPPLSQTVCAGSTLAVGFNGTSGSTFTWTNNNTAIGLGAGGTGGFTFMSTNTGAAPLVANLTVTPMLNGCSGITQNFTITINPKPTITLGAVTCAPDLLTYAAVVTSNANTLAATAGTVSGTSPNFTISNIPAGTSIIITATISTTNCVTQQAVNAPNCTCPPIAAPNMPNFPVICEGTATPALMVNVGAGLTVDWYSTPTGGTPVFTGSASFTPPGVLAPGTYTFYAEARDPGSGCISASRTAVTLTVNGIPTISQPLNQSVCNGFVISIGFNGTSGATFNWTNNNPAIGLGANGAGNISFNAINTGTTPITATLTVTPTKFGCQGSPRTFTVTVNPTPQAAITGDVQICNGENTTLTASGGSTYSWNTGAAGAGLTVTPTATTTYTVTVTENNCSTIATATVNVGQPSSATVNISTCDPAQVGTTTNTIPNSAGCDSVITTITALDPSICAPTIASTNGTITCFGGNDGALTISATNGLAPYTYNWSNGAQTGTGSIATSGGNAQLQNLTAGTYTITVTTASGLTTTVSAQVDGPMALVPIATAVTNFGQYPLSCFGATDATVQAAATGGTGQYQFSWSVAGSNAPVLQNVGAGTYTVTITDSNQCTASASAVVTPPPPLTLALALDDIVCGEDIVRASITPGNGVAPFSVTVDGIAGNNGLNPELSSGNHTIVLTDANQCTADTTLTVILPPAPLVQLPGDVTVTLGELLTLEAQTNLTAWENVTWNPIPNPNCPDCLIQEWIPQISGVYEVTIRDTFGCDVSASTRVTVRKADEIYIPNVFSPNDDGKEDFWEFNAGVSVIALNSVQVFDRWGDEVYHLATPTAVSDWKGWDGRFRGDPVNPGVFVYWIEIQLANGDTAIKKGDVTVVR
ncbi:MAG: gliding motility-associated C-terminal domain-containing protein [Saprospiraceae bacterium]|nr:gliding motility-associated C-terminal domain-containing protein [Saprospiraceae bacterium]